MSANADPKQSVKQSRRRIHVWTFGGVDVCLGIFLVCCLCKIAGKAGARPPPRIAHSVLLRPRGCTLKLRGGDEGQSDGNPTTAENKESVSVNLREAIKELKEHKTDISEIAATLRFGIRATSHASVFDQACITKSHACHIPYTECV